jgi:V/A-type H+-transporting ATPase subunit C
VPDFPYINARVRGMRSRLLTQAQMEDLLGAPSMPAFLQGLATTPYGGDLQEALARYEGLRAVDDALARNLQRTTNKILEFADGRPRALIEVLLLRWDLYNLRVIVRGKHAGRPPDEVMGALMPAGTLGEVVLREMAAYPDTGLLAGTLEAVEHPFAVPMAEGLAAYAASGDLTALEMRLDRAYVERGLRVAGGRGRDAAVLREILQSEIDVANVKTALRLASAGEMEEAQRLRYFMPGGTMLPQGLYLALSSPATQAQGWKKLPISGFPVRESPTNLVEFERELDLDVARALAAYYRRDPLGLDIVVGYMAMKSAEVANLRLIARGKFMGLPREILRREMVLV